jgi:hypothetical protein
LTCRNSSRWGPRDHRSKPDADPRHLGLNPHGTVDETVRRGEELYRKLGEQLPNVAVVVFDPEMRVLVAVGEALTSHEVQEREVEGLRCRR